MTKNFNLEEELEKLECPQMFIAGLKYHIEKEKIKIAGKKDLDKIVKEFGELRLN